MNTFINIDRYAQEFNQTESVNILKQFIYELERRNAASLKANDPNYHHVYGDEDDDEMSLPPLGPAFNGNEQCIYDDPEAIQYALPIVHQTIERNDMPSNHNYAVIYINKLGVSV